MMLFTLIIVIFSVGVRSTSNPVQKTSPYEKYCACNSEIMNVLTKMNTKIDALQKVINPVQTDKNCAEIFKRGVKTDGVYTIDPDGLGSFRVRCDMTTDGGGWTIFQRRLDGSVDFYQGWKSYKNGFGDLKGEFWLGLDKINRLTRNSLNNLRIDMEDTAGNGKYAKYAFFSVSAEKTKYQLSLGTYSGTAGDSFSGHKGAPFSTKDSDNDSSASGSCAISHHGAWWYTSCHVSNLNGAYHHGSHSSYADGINWHIWKGYNYSLRKAEMKIRPQGFPI